MISPTLDTKMHKIAPEGVGESYEYDAHSVTPVCCNQLCQMSSDVSTAADSTHFSPTHLNPENELATFLATKAPVEL
jgi:hypothetical protein